MAFMLVSAPVRGCAQDRSIVRGRFVSGGADANVHSNVIKFLT